ncbi:MAG: photosynthetic reaction center subunit H [Rhizobiaceae bacterium]|jgi:photosynthetic reaction center H subunit|nr:photosynthetic reaction center subunit H [Rhizobiaceae bacterium]
MELGAITEYVDTAQVLLYIFWGFFFALIFYLDREGRREGFPMENDRTGQYDKSAWLFMPGPKTFNLPHGHGKVTAPNYKRDNELRPVPGVKTARFSGAPYTPTGDNPMLDSIGPGSWADRADVPDMAHHGVPKLQPMRVLPDFSIAKGDMDPRGMRVVGHDSVIAGRVVDVWVDVGEQLIRYLELETGEGKEARRVLVPMNFCVIKTPRDKEKVFYVHAITGGQFALVPGTKKADQVTLLEEDRIMAYYGSGLLYSTPKRIGPKL